ncbi:GNAT family N-acetyltransferase [Agriterribacter humi]|jgi:predicted GNAT family acetyltransferase|uniref:GNAT family N-acetyltransferase n=1 Tax=Agriterribacter humi TaxID=1104781 RepID=UPI0012644401|nr:GNAT family N-acetyltransferase [Agriterribacter humi]
MEDVKLELNEKGHGHFYILDGEEQVAEMVISIAGDMLTVYHTEVLPKAEGKGLAKQLLAAMVDHARKNGLKVIPLCPYVHAQFKRHPDDYADVWHKSDQ